MGERRDVKRKRNDNTENHAMKKSYRFELDDCEATPTAHAGQQLEIDFTFGWGRAVEQLITAACDLSGQPELKTKLFDLLVAKEPAYEIREKAKPMKDKPIPNRSMHYAACCHEAFRPVAQAVHDEVESGTSREFLATNLRYLANLLDLDEEDHNKALATLLEKCK
jgi:hypothetical protein